MSTTLQRRAYNTRTSYLYNYILSETLRASSGGLFATTTKIIVIVIPSGWHRLLGRQVTRPSSTTPYVILIRFVSYRFFVLKKKHFYLTLFRYNNNIIVLSRRPLICSINVDDQRFLFVKTF